jgi:(1->4)-alpha-D-glucan 1-alpha-D-glucosylmutase
VTAGRVPGSTYRLQLTPEFGFAEAADAAEYLADLGVTHIYLSPVLEAVPGSRHGYDVTDHSRIRAELGGEEGFRAMAKRVRELGLSIILDVVPNHMAVPDNLTLNRQLWSVLRDGRESACANWFDVDWAQDDRIALPILGARPQDCLDDLRVEPGGGPDGDPVLRYFDHVLPLRPGTEQLPMAGLLESQHYRLICWRDATTELNWRRFFDVTTLIGIRVEDPAVFNASHEVFVGLLAEGLVDGLRVDHPDGLADPRGYLRMLATATSEAWVVVEKILEGNETLPSDWPCAGTTGYDALKIIDGLFLDPEGGDALTATYERFCGLLGDDSVPSRFAGVAVAAKRQIAAQTLHPEVARLVRLLGDSRPDAAPDDVLRVLTEVLASFPVYRAYVQPGEAPSAAAEGALRTAVDAASERLPAGLRELAADIGAAVLGMRAPVSGTADRANELVVRFQQTTGPVLAKGVEDTAFYRWSRLIALNEVGGDPDRFSVSPGEFHAIAGRLADDWAATMTTLSTHDTKRQEDVRARLAVLAEMPAEWGKRIKEWHEQAAALLSPGGAVSAGAVSGGAVSGETAVDPDTEHLLWQTLVGAWPISGERLASYMTKAMHEAKRQTSWTDVNAEYEAAVLALAASVLGDPDLAASIDEFVASIAADALANSLGAKLVQLSMVGVPDVYQGCELAGLSLVDPDNRRDVDFAYRRSLLADLDAGHLEAAGLESAPLAVDAIGVDAIGADAIGADSPGLNSPEPDGLEAGLEVDSIEAAGLEVESFDLDPGGPGRAGAVVARLDAAKLLVTARTLRLRRARPEWFTDGYAPLVATGPGADHVVAFSRGRQAVTVATRLPTGLRGRGGWAQTALELPGGTWTDLLSGAVYDGGTVAMAELTRRLPVALLIQEELLVEEVPLVEEEVLIQEAPLLQEPPFVQDVPSAEPPLVGEAG